jgi:hypothetical protein
MQRGLNVPSFPFTEEQFNHTKRIFEMLSSVEDRLMVRVNFDGETFCDKWALRCAVLANQAPNVERCEYVTNNSIPPDSYLSLLDPRKTSFNCSLHLEQMSYKLFLRNILHLKDSGCAVMVNICAVPQYIDQITAIREELSSLGIRLKVSPFLSAGRKRFQWKRYPRGYSWGERSFLKMESDSPDEYNYTVRLKRTRGRLCYAGVDMVVIYLHETVRRCFGGNIGSVEDLATGRVQLKKSPYPCETSGCPCYAHLTGLEEFRKKHVLSEVFVDNYDDHLPLMKDRGIKGGRFKNGWYESE